MLVVNFSTCLRDEVDSDVETLRWINGEPRSRDDEYRSREVEAFRDLEDDEFRSLNIGATFVECFLLPAGDDNKKSESIKEVRGRFPSSKQTQHDGFVQADASRLFGEGERSRREESGFRLFEVLNLRTRQSANKKGDYALELTFIVVSTELFGWFIAVLNDLVMCEFPSKKRPDHQENIK